ncbi:hypothetical protein AB5J56_32265 [Streptomyces sp. R21]|uniref:Uncharacterized protein n=1 Tax=Streptomyces sp. R21 TaxID=3238627 RepID=A0AB39PE93_9ACTN
MSGGLRIPPGTHEDSLPAVPRQRRPPSWAEPDPVEELAERLGDFIAAAVHPDEIAALLESDGMSDDRIRERYGVRNSFALAEELYDRVDRHYPEPARPAHDPWQLALLGCLLRGIVFALPGLGYVLGAPLLAGPHDSLGLPAGTVPLLVGALCGWTWNQGLAHRAYSWLGLGDRPAAHRALLIGAPAGVLLGSLAAFAAAPTHPEAVAFAAGQSCYLAAATVLLVTGRERALLVALLPMTAGAALALVHPMPNGVRLAFLLGSLTAVALVILQPVRRLRTSASARQGGRGGEAPRKTGREGAEGAKNAPRLTAALPYALYGLGSGVLVLHAALGDVLAGDQHSTVAAPAAVALTLSMGPAEWLLFRFRSAGLTALRSSSTPKDFRRTTALTLVRCLTGYVAALLALTAATAALWPHAPGVTGVRLAGLLLLGVVLWTGLLLQSFGAVLSAAAVCAVAALAQTAALAAHAGSPHWVGLTVYGTAAAALAVLVSRLLGRATAHR